MTGGVARCPGGVDTGRPRGTITGVGTAADRLPGAGAPPGVLTPPLEGATHLVGFDIETTGLDPDTDRVVSVSVVVGRPGDRSLRLGFASTTDPDDEAVLVSELCGWMRRFAWRHGSWARLVSWFGSGFDVPFLVAAAERAQMTPVGHGLDTAPVADPAGRARDRDLVAASWFGIPHHDLWASWKPWADRRGVPCRLKTVAPLVGVVPWTVTDAATAHTARLDRLVAYNLSDAALCVLLGFEVLAGTHRPGARPGPVPVREP